MALTYQPIKFAYLLLLISMHLLLLISCEKDNITSPVDMCYNTNYTYTLNMKPIFDMNCATASCHDGSNSLSDYSSYEGVFEDRIKLSDGINQGLEQITGGRAQLTEEEQDMVLCWIRDGAPQ